jgi:lipoyl(octanoyl) transferase
MPSVQYQNLGQMRYQAAWDYQTEWHRRLVDNKLNNRHLKPGEYEQAHALLLVEHPPVYTLGRSGSMEHLLLSEAALQERGIEFFPINRGGDITFHGPGQIVGYPILDLECFFTDVHRYVRNLEEVIIRTIAEYGLTGIRMPDYTGVWLAPNEQYPHFRKICAIGVHLSRWTTLHGWAFNVNTPLHFFDYIVPCGIADADKAVTSLDKELGHLVEMEAVRQQIKRHFAAVFECELY